MATTSNTEIGIAQLIFDLEVLSVERVVLEATDGLELLAAVQLSQVGLPVAVVNPRHVRDVARAAGQLAKTDTIDAAILAHFAEVIQPEVRPLASEETRQLSEFVTRHHQLVEMITAEKNRRAVIQGAVRDQIDRHIEWLQEQLNELDEQLQQIIR